MNRPPIIKAIYFLAVSVILISCKNETSETAKNEPQKNEVADLKSSDQQLNITILLDLSDRIEPTKYPAKPEHYERDIEIVNYFTKLFKAEMANKGAYKANGKIKVIFSPKPADDEINSIAENLNVDLSKLKDNKAKKDIYDNISQTFVDNLNTIYSKAIDTKTYPGSDIWRFFKNDVHDYTIDSDPAYRNILVILTDGYLYHKDSREIENNRSAYLLPKTVQSNGLRASNWREKFEKKDYGYISTRDDLDDLEILVLEVSPSPDHKNDEDVIKAYLSKWFKEMNVSNFKIYNSDLPEYTKSRINSFINRE